MASGKLQVHAAQGELPAVPLTVEGLSVLHQMLRFRWGAWRALATSERAAISAEAADAFAGLERENSAVYALLGHKGDLMVVHFRDSFARLKQVELALSRLRVWDYLEPASSYLSVIELGLYESTMKTYRELQQQGVEPHSSEWKQVTEEVVRRQREAMRTRLEMEIPGARYLCFYPMNRRRGEEKNWYTLPMEERARQLEEHGTVGRRYAGAVRQVITGSIGFDDWEWGVDLFADDPLVFKKLIYEMRFDEVSAVYAEFGTFYVGVRFPAAQVGQWLSGELPDVAPAK
ncbi:MAG: heme-dependent peroxidase [Acidobacteria bacterium]|nr:heme-dependent peroxidase [Acidobacteriota bacterium]